MSCRGTLIGGTCFEGENFGIVDFGRPHLRAANYGEASLAGVALRRASFVNADFKGAASVGWEFRMASFEGKDSGDRFQRSGLKRAKLWTCTHS